MHMRSQEIGLRNQVYGHLQTIRKQCKNNQKPTAAPTSYKPLLLTLSQNYHIKNSKLHKPTASGITSKSKSAMTHTRFSSSQKGCYTLPLQIFQKRNKTKPKIMNSTNFFMTGNFLEQECEEREIEQFLLRLYNAKTKDIKIQPNAKQRQMFLARLAKTVSEQVIVARESDLGAHAVIQIFNFCKKFPQLKVLNLDRNPIGDEGTFKLSEMLVKLPLQDLSVMSANMSSRGGFRILQAIVGHPTLKSLNLSSPDGFNRNKIGNEALSTLTEIFCHQNCKIQRLELESVGMGETGFLSFCTGIKNSVSCHLRHINFSSNQIKVNPDNARYVKICLEKLPAVKIELQQNQLGDIAGDIFGYILGTLYGKSEISTTLEYLDLSSNSMKSCGLDLLCSGLSYNKKITDLLLSNNNLGEGECFYKFRAFLCANWTIKRLTMRNCLGQSSNLKYIAEGLRKNRSLYQLDISCNLLEVDDVFCLFEEMEINNVMETLKMESCNIADACIAKIYTHLQHKCPLRELNLANNYLTNVGASKILKVLMDRHQIIALNLKKNCINSNILNDIAYQIKDNKIMFENRNEDPELEYFQKAIARQEQKKQNLIHAIQQLEQKNQKMKLKGSIENLISQENLFEEKKNEYDQEQRYIRELESKLQAHQNSPRQLPEPEPEDEDEQLL